MIYKSHIQQQPIWLWFQIGSYFGSVVCSVDVDRDSVTDVLLVGAPMFMNDLKKEEGRVYMFSITKVKWLKPALLRANFLQIRLATCMLKDLCLLQILQVTI